MHWDAGHTDDCMIDESIDDPELATALMQSMQETRKKTPPPKAPLIIDLTTDSPPVKPMKAAVEADDLALAQAITDEEIAMQLQLEEERRLSSQNRPLRVSSTSTATAGKGPSFSSSASDEALAKILQQQEEQQERYRLAHGSRQPRYRQHFDGFHPEIPSLRTASRPVGARIIDEEHPDYLTEVGGDVQPAHRSNNELRLSGGPRRRVDDNPVDSRTRIEVPAPAAAPFSSSGSITFDEALARALSEQPSPIRLPSRSAHQQSRNNTHSNTNSNTVAVPALGSSYRAPTAASLSRSAAGSGGGSGSTLPSRQAAERRAANGGGGGGGGGGGFRLPSTAHRLRNSGRTPHGSPGDPINQLVRPGEDTYEALLRLDERNIKVGYTDSSIDSLPTRTWSQSDQLRNSASEQHKCHVCLEDYEVGEVLRSISCLHSFHRDCIDKWLKSHKQCPVCRAEAIAH